MNGSHWRMGGTRSRCLSGGRTGGIKESRYFAVFVSYI